MSREKQRLLARKEKIEQRLADLRKEEERRREREEKRKAELAGRAVLNRADKDEHFAQRLQAVLAAEITGARDRTLFGLPPSRPSASARSGTPEAELTRLAESPGMGQADSPGPAEPDSGLSAPPRERAHG